MIVLKNYSFRKKQKNANIRSNLTNMQKDKIKSRDFTEIY